MRFKMYNIKNEIKANIMRKGYTLTALNKALNKKFNRNNTVQNLTSKINNETIKYKEILEIAEVLDYKIKWE